jgi:DNA-binding XRE family transcriptional regulator
MKKEHVGRSFFEDVKEWEKSPSFRKAVEEHKERAMLALLLRQTRSHEEISQLELAKRAGVTQSVIARMESSSARPLPRLDILKRIMNAMGYETVVMARKGKLAFKAAL